MVSFFSYIFHSFLNNDNNFNDNDQYENGGGELYDNNERTAVKKKQKNEWSLTEQITPFQMLKRTNQRWVWDLAFSADSQYVFTGMCVLNINRFIFF